MTSTLTSKSPNTRTAKQHVMLKVALVLLAVSALPTASAQRDCWVDSFGRRRCRLSVGARIAIAVSITVACILLILAIGLARRRRVARANQAFVTAQQHQQAHPYGNPANQYQYGNSPYDQGYAAQYQQYPPPGQGFYNSQGSQGGFAPPPGPPPPQPPQYQEYNPPRSPPPAAKT